MAYSAEVPSGYTPGITDEEVFKTYAQSVVPPPHQYESIIFADSLERPYLYGLWLMYYNVMLIMASKYAGPNKAAYVNMYTNGGWEGVNSPYRAWDGVHLINGIPM